MMAANFGSFEDFLSQVNVELRSANHVAAGGNSP
jgi:hypothetical protein